MANSKQEVYLFHIWKAKFYCISISQFMVIEYATGVELGTDNIVGSGSYSVLCKIVAERVS